MNFKKEFEVFKKECEKYSDSDLQSSVVIALSGSSKKEFVFRKLIKIYELETDVNYLDEILSEEETIRRERTHHIMLHSLHYFVKEE